VIIAFDFDGVLVDSFTQLARINELGAEAAGKTLTPAQYRAAFTGPIHVELARVLGLTPEENEAFRAAKKAIFAAHYSVDTVQFWPFAAPLIKRLVREGHALHLVTAAPEPFVNALLRKADLLSRFASVTGYNTQGKAETLARLKPDVFVTDTVGDVLEAKGVVSTVVGVTWGFHSPNELFLAGAQPVRTPGQLAEMFGTTLTEDYQ
jgi:phosphoglycolate phosphatase